MLIILLLMNLINRSVSQVPKVNLLKVVILVLHLTEVAIGRHSTKQVFIKLSQSSHENTCAGVSL